MKIPHLISSLRQPVFIVSALSLLLGAACSKSTGRDQSVPSPKVENDQVIFSPSAPQLTSLVVAPAEASPVSIRRVTGRLVWDEDSTVRVYSPVGGRVVAIDAKLGDDIAAGASLAKLNSPDFGQALADARKADADLLFAERTLNRTRDLFEHGSSARKDLDSAENAYAGAVAEQQRAASHLALFGADHPATADELFTLKAPTAGVVVEKIINLGQEIRSDLMLANGPQLLAPQFVLADPRRPWVLWDITEMDLAGLKPGQSLQIVSRSLPGHPFAGRLDNIGHSLDPSTRTVKARGVVDNPDLALKAEMYVDVGINLDTTATNAVAIKSGAVCSHDGHSFVFVEKTPGTFDRVEVQPGSESSGQILIGQGLRVGDRVLVEGALLVEAIVESGGKS